MRSREAMSHTIIQLFKHDYIILNMKHINPKLTLFKKMKISLLICLCFSTVVTAKLSENQELLKKFTYPLLFQVRFKI